MNKIKLAIIGYRRHASRHIQYYKNHPKVDELIIYHPTSTHVGITNNISDVLRCDGVIVSSPTHTHLEYIEFLHSSSFSGAVYLEKPGFSTQTEANKLRAISDSKNSLNIIIGYHERYSERTKRLTSALNNFDTGAIIRVSMLNSKGISYKDFFANDWRSKGKDVISHTLVGHHLSIFSAITHNKYMLKRSDFNVQIFKNPENNHYDTVICTKLNCYPLLDSLNSWGMPLRDQISVMCTNCIIEADKNMIKVYHPRDSYDNNGFFKKPKLQSIVRFRSEELSGIQEHFINGILNKQKFCTNYLDEDIAIGEITLSS